MLGAARTQGLIQTGHFGQGMPDAGNHDAQPAQVNPAWASQPMLAAHRLATLPDTQTLMGEVFRDTRFPHQPTRKTLADTIRLLALSGNVSADQARWLADNKSHPNRLWSAIGYLSTYAANDDSNQIIRGIHSRLTEIAPLRQIGRFVTAWAKQLPEVIDPRLINELHKLMQINQNPDQDIRADWAAFNHALAGTLKAIAAELNERMNPKLLHHGEPLELTLCFAGETNIGGGLLMGADHTMGLELGVDVMTTSTAYWKAMTLGLTLIQKHLFPLYTPTNLADMGGMMIDEVEDDLNGIAAYLTAHNLDDSEANVEEAISASNCFIIECYEAWEHYVAEVTMHQEIVGNWKLEAEATVDLLTKTMASLPAPKTEHDKRLSTWLNDVASALEPFQGKENWCVERAHLVSDSSEATLPVLDELTPVYCEDDRLCAQYAEQMHEMYMQGDDGAVMLSWDADPKTILEWVNDLNKGHQLLAELFLIGNDDTE
ncbi:hypothetical protein Maqu_4311 (plasmid) [Marinobacter nauticus VT8]|uniref:Uncharacterized protein n=2 Tax=Marinobacter nauticus TaxID=2743 RepID=A1U843_MARN8|nr:hypothetical protein Maqu_4311 [Marinobacter nauticus VT8]